MVGTYALRMNQVRLSLLKPNGLTKLCKLMKDKNWVCFVHWWVVNLDISHIILEMDCKSVVDKVNGIGHELSESGAIVQDLHKCSMQLFKLSSKVFLVHKLI